MGGVRNVRMIKVQVCCSMGCKWCMAYAYILVCYVIPRASPSELHKHPRMYMLLHPCEGYIRFTSAEPEGVVLVNRIFPVQGCNM